MSKTITLCEGCLLRISHGSFYNDTFIFNGVSVWSSSSESIHLGIKRKRKKKPEKELVASPEHMESFKAETFIMVHPHNPLPNHPSYSISSRLGCTVSMNTDHPQKHKTALMHHLLKQQDYFISLDHVLDP